MAVKLQASIYNAYKSKLPLDQVNVQIKLSVIKQKDQAEDIIHNISKYANSQNKINMSDFNANDAYHVKMERLCKKQPQFLWQRENQQTIGFMREPGTIFSGAESSAHYSIQKGIQKPLQKEAPHF